MSDGLLRIGTDEMEIVYHRNGEIEALSFRGQRLRQAFELIHGLFTNLSKSRSVYPYDLCVLAANRGLRRNFQRSCALDIAHRTLLAEGLKFTYP
jgi:hypothetical protein